MTADLRRLAEQTTPGPWVTGRIRKHGWTVDGPVVTRTVLAELSALNDEANAAYIAAANPQAILALLDERDALEAHRDALAEANSQAIHRWDEQERRVAALEEVVRRFLSLEVRDTRRGSLPLRADSFAGIAEEARALLAAIAQPERQEDE